VAVADRRVDVTKGMEAGWSERRACWLVGLANLANLARQPAFQRHVLGPKSRFSWKGPITALPLAPNSARICAELRPDPYAAFPSPQAQNLKGRLERFRRNRNTFCRIEVE
jgi:hypothetical protein